MSKWPLPRVADTYARDYTTRCMQAFANPEQPGPAVLYCLAGQAVLQLLTGKLLHVYHIADFGGWIYQLKGNAKPGSKGAAAAPAAV